MSLLANINRTVASLKRKGYGGSCIPDDLNERDRRRWITDYQTVVPELQNRYPSLRPIGTWNEGKLVNMNGAEVHPWDYSFEF
jgi:hypothetical protein